MVSFVSTTLSIREISKVGSSNKVRARLAEQGVKSRRETVASQPSM